MSLQTSSAMSTIVLSDQSEAASASTSTSTSTSSSSKHQSPIWIPDQDFLNEFQQRMNIIIQSNRNYRNAIGDLEANLNFERQRISDYHQYATSFEGIRRGLEMELAAADRKAAKLESLLLKEQASHEQLQLSTNNLRARELELEGEVQTLKQQNEDCNAKLEKAHAQVLERVTWWYSAYERAERLQNILASCTSPTSSDLPMRNIGWPVTSGQSSGTGKGNLLNRRKNKDLRVSTDTSGR